jgi:energy-coupling factor transporter ATP-binding protein EcfA2
VSADSRGLLLLDEPDVHLHPDLQSRLVKFLVKLIDEFDFDILMATHSTSILGELAETSAANVCLMTARQKDLTFEPVDDIYKQLLPVFGAHPLTRVFSESPTLLVEGEDDVRIWQQAVRSANGALKIYPVECGGLPYMAKYEDRLARVMNAVYDGATAYSLRDRDDSELNINDIPPVVRMRLSCRSAENLLLSDDVISLVDLTWEVVQSRISEWFKNNSEKPHPKFDAMKSFVEQGMLRKSADLKELRMILVGQILASNKPWEVLVGQAIGNIAGAPTVNATDDPDSIRAYLGDEVVRRLLAS